MRISLIMASLLCLSNYAIAQPIAGYGCLSSDSGNPTPIVNNAVYQTLSGNYSGKPAYRTWSTTYSDRSTDAVNYPCWNWITVTPNGCYLRRQNGQPNQSNNFVLGNYGYFSGQNGTDCDLDNDIWILLSGNLVLSLFSIYNCKYKHLEVKN